VGGPGGPSCCLVGGEVVQTGVPHLGVLSLGGSWWWGWGSPIDSGGADVGRAARRATWGTTTLHSCLGGTSEQQKWQGVPCRPPHVCVSPPRCTRRSSVAASRSWRGCGSGARPRRGRHRSEGSRPCSSRCCSCSRRSSSCRRTWPSCCRSGSCWNGAAPPSSASAPSWHPGWRRPSGR